MRLLLFAQSTELRTHPQDDRWSTKGHVNSNLLPSETTPRPGEAQDSGHSPIGVKRRQTSKWDVPVEQPSVVSLSSSSSSAAPSHSAHGHPAAAAAAAAAKAISDRLEENFNRKREALWAPPASDQPSEATAPRGVASPSSSPSEKTRTEAAYKGSFGQNASKRAKFLKLLGAGDAQVVAAKGAPPPEPAKMESDLEREYISGLRRKDGRKDGLGT